MFTLYMKWDAQEQLNPEDIQFIYRPTEAMELASIFYELDYTQYHQQSYPRMRIPERRHGVHYRHFSEPYRRRRADYSDELYDDVESYLRMGWMIGIDTREEWDHFSHPFSFDQDSNLVFDCFMDHGTVLFEQNVRRIYEESLNKHQGRKPLPTVRFRPSGEPVQHAQATKTLNSKGVGRLLAAGGVYNGNVEGYRQTAEQLGGEAPAGFDQVLNETTKGVAIAAVSVAAGLGIGRFGATSEVSELKNLHALGKVEGEFSAINPGPLNDRFAETFSGGVYKEITLSDDTSFYRAGVNGSELGRFFGYEQPESVIQARIDKAVLPKWPGGAESPLDSFYEINIPAGTKVYVGEAGYQSDFYLGGTEQVVIPNPWDISGVKVLSNGVLK